MNLYLQASEPSSMDDNALEHSPINIDVKKTPSANPVKIDDLRDLLPKSSAIKEADVASYVTNHATFVMELRLKKLNNCVDELRECWPEATPMDLYIAFDMNNCDRDETIYQLSKHEFRCSVKETLDQKLCIRPQPIANPEPVQQEASEESENDGEFEADDEFVCQELLYEPSVKPSKPRKRTEKRVVVPGGAGKSPGDIPQDVWDSWSDARRNSYKIGNKFPNAHYYRHLPPGEVQRNGQWTKEEKSQFLKRLKEMRGDSDTMSGDWGLFSLTIPGRVGYQCSNFYRKLVECGEVHDSCYFRAKDGKIHHIRRAHLDSDGVPVPNHYKKGKNREVEVPTKKVTRDRPLRATRVKAIKEDEVKTLTLFSSSSSVSSLLKNDHQMGRYEEWALENPITGAIDPITESVMRVPAISPDGYVLDYNTWMNSLKTAHENPFTRIPLNKRQLIILTYDNIDDYREKIVNITIPE